MAPNNIIPDYGDSLNNADFAWAEVAVGGNNQRNSFARMDQVSLPDPGAGDCFMSVFRYPSHVQGLSSISDYDGQVMVPSIPFDFDGSADDIGQALQDCIESIRILEYAFDLQPDSNLLVFFSGRRGFHLRLPSAIVGGSPITSPTKMAEWIKAFVARLFPGLISLDMGLYAKHRLLRIPNTLHSGSGLYKVPLRLAELYSLDVDSIKNLAQSPRPEILEEVLMEHEPQAHGILTGEWQASEPEETAETTAQGGGDYLPGDVTKIVDSCSFLAYCRDDAAVLPEPYWWSMISLLARCKDGRDIAHQWSKPYPGYSAKETDYKFDYQLKQAEKGVGPHTCSFISNSLQYGGCAECTADVKSPAVLGLPGTDDNRPEICFSGSKNLAEHREQAFDALCQYNADDPQIFRLENRIVEVKMDERGGVHIQDMERDRLRNLVDLTAYCYKWEKSGDDYKQVQVYPPATVINSMLAEVPPFPPLRKAVQVPVFGPGGDILTSAGYHPHTETYYQQVFKVPPIPDTPKAGAIAKAKKFIADNVFVDFPFADVHSRAYAWALLLEPYVRQIIGSNSPLYIIDSVSGPGSGKTLLAQLVLTIATGREPGTYASVTDEDEWRKSITSVLLGYPEAVIYDNYPSDTDLDSAGLSNALTTDVWRDRRLGFSEVVTLPADCTWALCGNGVRATGEVSRRSVQILLDCQMPDPYNRLPEVFVHPNIRQWVADNRGHLVRACLTIIRGWVVAGMPTGSISMGSFERWAEVMGGILQVAGIPGFLENKKQMHLQVDQETQMWQEFANEWYTYQAINSKASCSPGELYNDVLLENDLSILSILGGSSDRGQVTSLGMRLSRMTGRQFRIHHSDVETTLQIVKDDNDTTRSNRYRLDVVKKEVAAGEVPF